MEVVSNNYLPGEQRLVEKIVYELKAQGIFDQFRKECFADVDTKPAYQNLRQRVEGSVSGFLRDQSWRPDMNKNQVREMLRKKITESGYLETGVERIVDQVVNPKINTVFLPKVEEVVYSYLGIEKPARNEIHKVDQSDLLPNDLEAVSPESEPIDRKDDKSSDNLQDLDETKTEEDESPPFEPLDEQPYVPQEENSVDSHLSGFSGLVSHESDHSNENKVVQVEHDSQMSRNSSDSRLSIVTSDENSKMDVCEDSQIKPAKLVETKQDDKHKHKSSDRHKSRSESKSDKDRHSSKDSKSRHSSSSKDKDKKKDSKSDSKSSSSSSSKNDKPKDKNDKERSRSSSSKHSSSKDNKSKEVKKESKSDKEPKSDQDKESKPNKDKDSKDKVRSSSSSHKDSKSRDKSSDSKSKSSDKHKHSSSSSSSHKKDKDKDKKREKSKDDHYSSKEKKNDRRSTDRDSNDGQSSKSSQPSNDTRTSQSQKSTQQSVQGSGDSGNTDNSENTKPVDKVEGQRLKLFKPKCASNIQEAMKLMKIRKQLAKLEKQNQLSLASVEVSTSLLLSSSIDLKDLRPNGLKTMENNEGAELTISNQGAEVVRAPAKNTVISQDSWEKLETQLQEESAIEEDSIEDCRYFDTVDMGSNEFLKFVNGFIKEAEKYKKVKQAKKRKIEDTDVKNNNNNKKAKVPSKTKKRIKRNNNNMDVSHNDKFLMPLSPAESDKSVEKKDEISVPLKPKRNNLLSSQRYSSDDLYKPRSTFTSSRRRGAKGLEN